MTKISANYIVARLLKGPVGEKCASFPDCGGCSLLHFDYAETLRIKERYVADCLERIGGFRDIDVSPIVPSPKISGFRNKTVYRFAHRDGRLVCGFFRRGSHEVVDASDCNSEHPVSQRISRAFCGIWQKLGLSIYDEDRGTGLLRALMIRVSDACGEAMVCVCVNAPGFPEQEALAASLSKACPEVVSVYVNVNRSRGNTILGDEFKLILGTPVLRDNIGNAVFDVPPEAFFQVNPGAAELLYQKALSYAEAGLPANAPRKPLLDIYCGIGSIGIYFAKNSRAFSGILGVEWTPGACEAASANVRTNGIADECGFFAGDAGTVIKDVLSGTLAASTAGTLSVTKAKEMLESAETAVIDPPRKGLDGTMPALLSGLGLKKIVYVSCNPSTLARDLARFASLGWEIKEACPVDMFPFAGHVECVTLITRNR